MLPSRAALSKAVAISKVPLPVVEAFLNARGGGMHTGPEHLSEVPEPVVVQAAAESAVCAPSLPPSDKPGARWVRLSSALYSPMLPMTNSPAPASSCPGAHTKTV